MRVILEHGRANLKCGSDGSSPRKVVAKENQTNLVAIQSNIKTIVEQLKKAKTCGYRSLSILPSKK